MIYSTHHALLTKNQIHNVKYTVNSSADSRHFATALRVVHTTWAPTDKRLPWVLRILCIVCVLHVKLFTAKQRKCSKRARLNGYSGAGGNERRGTITLRSAKNGRWIHKVFERFYCKSDLEPAAEISFKLLQASCTLQTVGHFYTVPRCLWRWFACARCFRFPIVADQYRRNRRWPWVRYHRQSLIIFNR